MNKGQSLFEVIFALSIAAVILTSVVSLATISIKNSDYSANKTMATKYAQEAIEWLRGQRDAKWSDPTNNGFLERAAANNGTYCLDSLGWTNTGNCASDEFISVNDLYLRQVVLTCYQINASPPPDFNAVACGSTTDNIQAEVSVSWTDGSGTHSVQSTARFTHWNY